MFIITQASQANTLTAGSAGVFTAYGTTSQLNLLAPGSGRLEGDSFIVRASGYTTLAAGTYTSTVTVTLYGVANTLTATAIAWTAASGNSLVASSALSVTQAGTTSVTVPWMIEATMQGDSVSGKLQGVLSRAMISNTATTQNTALSNAPTGVAFASEPPLQFAVGVAIGTNLNNTKSQLDSFLLEA